MEEHPHQTVAASADAYLVALLDDGLHGAAREALATELEGSDGSDPLEPLRAARSVVARRVRIDPVLDVHLLHDELGLPVDQVADLLRVAEGEVTERLAEAHALLDGPAPGQPRRVVIDDLALPRDPAPTLLERTAPSRRSGGVAGCTEPVCVREDVVTSGVDANGMPVDDREQLLVGEPVAYWLRYDVGTTAVQELTVVWLREGVELYRRTFALPAADRVVLRLDAAFASGPGSYSVEVRGGEGVIASSGFVLLPPEG
jgi:hypothetical protein